MKVTCLAENYKCQEIGEKIICINSLYESSLKFLSFAALLEVLSPEMNELYIPLAIEIEAAEGSDIIIYSDLGVQGTIKYDYFIPTAHYNKWKRTFRFTFWIIFLAEALVSLLLLYIFFVPSNFNPLVGASFFIVAGLTAWFARKYYKENKRIRKYEIRDL